jgi:hypothetical protein
MDFPQRQVPSVCKGHARRGEVAVCRPIQRSNDGQRDKLGKLPSGLVALVDWAHRQYCLTFVLRDLEVDCFVRRSRISRQMLESFRDRRRSRRKIEKDARVTKIHLCRDVQPEERIARLDRGEL